MDRQTIPRRFDPMRAHGAWIYLFASVASGALIGANRGVEPAMLVGTAFTGSFLVASALSTGARHKVRQLWIGMSCAILAPCAAWFVGAESGFLVVAMLAMVPALGAMVLIKTRGFLSKGTVITGIAALGMAAPATAVAGGASVARSALLFALLWPFFCWRSLRIAIPLEAAARWDPKELKARGLREAAIAAGWTIAVVILLLVF